MPDQTAGDQPVDDTAADEQAKQKFAEGITAGLTEDRIDRPKATQALKDRVAKWWKITNDVPDFRKAVAAWLESQKILYPQWFDTQDAFRGQVPQELHSREDDRRVRVQFIYRNVQQMLAMLLPEDHTFEWEPVHEIGADPEKPDPLLSRFSETLHAVEKMHLEEIQWQDITNGFGQDSICFRMASLKITYEKSFINSMVHIDDEGQDKQKAIQKLRVLAEDFGRNRFSDNDAQYQEMIELKESLGVEGELQFWSGIRAENIPLDCIRWSSTVRDLDRIHLSPWISQDAMMTVDDIKEKYPFAWDKDADGKQLETWKGVHPEDLDAVAPGTAGEKHRIMGDSFWTSQTAAASGNGAQSVPTSEAQMKRLLVREIHSRNDNRIIVLVENLEYPALSYVPTKVPSTWYPFRFMRLNRVTGTCYGISDVEIMHDIQNRINRKRSDEENARWLSISRWVYDTSVTDEEVMLRLKDLDPGVFKGLNFQSKKLSDIIQELKVTFDPKCFDTTKDEQDMRQMANLPEQMQGVTGRAHFSSEVKAAQQGAQISATGRGTIVQRCMEGIYTHIAEILLQELDPDEVKQDCGAEAFWPHVYGADDAKAMMAKITAQAEQQLQQQEMAAADAAALGQAPAPQASPDERESAKAIIVKQLCQQVTGYPEIMTRESLFKRLRCKVTVALNAQAEQDAKGQALEALFKAINDGAAAAKQAGYVFDPMVIIKDSGNPEWDGLFTKDVNQLGAQLGQLLQQNPQIDPMLAFQVVQLLMPAAQQGHAQMVQQAAQQHPGIAGGQPAPGQQAQPA